MKADNLLTKQIGAPAIRDLLKLFSIEQERHFFEELEKCIEKHFNLKDFCFVSSSRLDEVNQEKMRVLAGRKRINAQFWKRAKELPRDDVFHHVGDKKNQHFFLITLTPGLDESIKQILVDLIDEYFSLMSKIEELKKNQDLIYMIS